MSDKSDKPESKSVTVVIASATQVALNGEVLMTGEAMLRFPEHGSRIVKVYAAWLQDQLDKHAAECQAAIAAANERVVAAEATAAAAVTKSLEVEQRCEADLAARTAEIRAVLEERAAAFDADRAKFASFLEGAEKQLAAAKTEVQRANQLQILHWQLTQACMNGGTSEAAVGLHHEIERVNLEGEIARLQAKRAAVASV